MEEIVNLFHGFAVVIQPYNLLLMVIGIMLGVIIGVLPGLGGANGVAILLPLTFSMSPTSAIIMLSCIYWGALFGGAITSVLFNIPGEPWSVATTFDGHPMAQQGRAGEALTAEKESRRFEVDTTPPRIEARRSARSGRGPRLRARSRARAERRAHSSRGVPMSGAKLTRYRATGALTARGGGAGHAASQVSTGRSR